MIRKFGRGNKGVTRGGYNRGFWLLAICLSLFQEISHGVELPDQWMQDFKKAKVKAAKANKPVFAVFSTSWCGPCQRLVHQIYPQKKVIEALDHFIPVYIDGDIHTDLLTQFGVNAFPTMIILDPSGQETTRFGGGASTAKAFIERLAEVREYTEKIGKLNAGLKENPEDIFLLKKRGDLLTGLGFNQEPTRLMQGIKDYEKARSLDPDNKTGVEADLSYLKLLRPPQTEEEGKDPSTLLESIAGGFRDFAAQYPSSHRVPATLFLHARIELMLDRSESGQKLLKEYLNKYPDHELAAEGRYILEAIREAEHEKSSEQLNGNTGDNEISNAQEDTPDA